MQVVGQAALNCFPSNNFQQFNSLILLDHCILYLVILIASNLLNLRVFCFGRFRQVLTENEPEVQEVSGLFRAVLLETLERIQDEKEAQRLTRQWNNKRSISLSMLTFKSRMRINPFGSSVALTSSSSGLEEVHTISQDVEKGLEHTAEKTQRVFSMPDFRHKGINGHV